VSTLVVSDLHLGTRLRHDVLRSALPLERLLDALDGVDRLVLLGDTIELLEGRVRDAMAIAEPVLRALGRRIGRGREIVVVAGNHDGALVRPWVRAAGASVQAETDVPPDATPELRQVVSWLAPARARVAYPGVWLSDSVWATHGHYLDRHLLPESAYGIARGLLGRLPRDGARPIEYELAGPSLTRLEAALTRWLPPPLAWLADDLAELARAATMPRIPADSIPHRFAPLTAMLLGLQMRRASIPALARVVHRLGVAAEFVIFGHVHRLGPLPGDVASQWAGPGGRPQVLNSGSWVYEPRLVHRARRPHPYWPGGAVLIGDDGSPPRATGLLDDVDRRALH
jgi:UDP-2,3-diacylglucosamine pyrophosphatase LpxH